jgi:tetratricopeptide (TPR) repeat protein
MIWSSRHGGAGSTRVERALAPTARSIRGRSALAAVAGWVVALGLAGAAQAMQLTPAQKAEMKQHYEKATRAYDVQKYSEAVEEYQKAYEIGGDPAMLYNVAQSYRLADQLPEALRFYRRYLQRSPNARNREDVERKIADLEKTVEERRKAAAAVPPPVVTPPPPVTPPPATPEMPPPDEGSPGLRIAGIVVASIGGAALIAAGVTAKLSGDKSDELSDASSMDKVFDPSVESSGKMLEKVAIASAIAGGAAAITGTILIIAGSGGEGGRSATGTEQHASSRSVLRTAVAPLLGGDVVGATAVVRF